jgi:hypothetical protein
MKIKSLFALIFILVATSVASQAVVRTYRQFKDVSVNESGKTMQSTDKEDLFECKYDIDLANQRITRISIRRLDEAMARTDNKVFTLTKKKQVFDSPEGRGGDVYVGVSTDGAEIVELGNKFAFTTRTGMFSHVINGVYKRIYTEEDHKHHK